MVREIRINLTNKLFYSLVIVSVVVLLAVGVYAYGTSIPSIFGHSAGELDFSSPITQDVTFDGDVIINGQLTAPNLPTGGSLENVYMFGHIGAILSDGAYVSNKEIGVNVGCTVKYTGAARVNNGQVETSVKRSFCDCGAAACAAFACDTGWVTGNAKCDKVFASQNRIVATMVPNKDGARFYVTSYAWNTVSGWVVSSQPSLDGVWQ